MRLKIVLYALATVLLFTRCSETDYSEVELTGSDIVRLYAGSLSLDTDAPPSRAAASTSDGDVSQISLYMTGGVTCDGVVLTLVDDEWVNDSVTLRWTSDADAKVMAYCPPLVSGASLYNDDGSLRDWLLCDKTVSYCNAVTLDFKHLTSQVSFTLDTSLNDNLEEISFTPSLWIEAIDAWTGAVSCNIDNLKTATFARNEDGCYTINVPAGEALTIDISLNTTDGKAYTAMTDGMTFTQGVKYSCTICSDSETAVGISSAEDFTELLSLLSGEEAGGKSLDDYGVTGDGGVTTYSLLCDIDLTGMEIQTISTEFEDCFDGHGYTISGLELLDAIDGKNYGLFNHIGTGGNVKNLTLKGAQLSCTGETEINNTGLLCGINEGVIDNCHLDGCTISSVQSLIAGCLVGMNQGATVNCSVVNTTIYNSFSSSSIAAGLVGQNEGDVANCYVTQSTLYCDQTAGICGKNASYGTITNVYVYKITKRSGNDHGGVVFNHATGTYANCFSSVSYGVYNLSTQPDGMLQFTQASGELPTYNGETLDTIFNAWIDGSASSVYPSLSLLKWEQGDTTIPYLFVSE